MSVREIDGYSQHAIGNGCFFNQDPQQRINDPVTGRLRRERVFTSDRMIDVEDEGLVEFGERFASEIAHVLGWVAPKTHEAQVQMATDMEAERDAALARAQAAEDASLTNVRQTAAALEAAEEAKERMNAVVSQSQSFKGTISALKRKVEKLEKELAQARNFGDKADD